MAIAGNADSADAKIPKLDRERTFSVLTSPARRKLLLALAVGGSRSGADLKHAGRARTKTRGDRVFTQSTLANLKTMVEAGIVLKQDHQSDGRRVQYRLSPAVKVTRIGSEFEFDFGFCVALLPVGADLAFPC